MDFPPPEMTMPPPNFQPQGYQPRPYNPNFHHHKPFYKSYKHGGMAIQDDFDGKRLRKSVMRKTIDYNSSIVKALESRLWQRDHRDRRALQPENSYIPDLMPPSSYLDNPSNCITTRFVKTATNKMRCPVFTLAWTPEGRRLITGASSGEFTLWNGLTFNFETILQAHSTSVRSMMWSHSDNWMVTADHNGYVKYWQSNMNNVKQFQAHKEPIRGLSFCPTDSKFATCSDDGTVRIFDFLRCQEERVLRGHGADVKCVHWHPQKALVVSGSKDNQQPIKLWDPKSGQALSTLHAHKSTVMDLKWNDNGNWLITASRDHLLKLFDLRNLKEEMQSFRGHKKEASAVCWHPIHEGLFVSGGSDGQILFWNVGTDKEVGGIEMAHESIVWTLAFHPLGHILCSGSNDHTVKFWTRNRPGDQMRDKYNLNTLPASLAALDEYEMDDHVVIPGMGIEENNEFDDVQPTHDIQSGEPNTLDNGIIPGLDFAGGFDKKAPYSKPIPKSFQAQWNVEGGKDGIQGIMAKLMERLPGIVKWDAQKPEKINVYGKEFDMRPGTKIHQAMMSGFDVLFGFIQSDEFMGQIEEDHQVSNDSMGNDYDQEANEPQAKRFRPDFEDSNDSNQNQATPWDNPPPMFNNNNNNNNNQQKTRGRKQGGSRWSNRR